MVTHCHQLQRKQQKKVHDYSQKSIDDFKLIIVNPSPKLIDQEKSSVMNYFGSPSKYQCIETKKKRILTHVSNHRNKNKSIAHPSTCALYPYKNLALKIYSIEIK